MTFSKLQGLSCAFHNSSGHSERYRYTKALLSIKGLRKDRLADLKAEKEKLVSLSREKAHYDKLRDRVNEQKATITAKELDCEDSKRQYDALVVSNQKFYELHQKFREMYVTVEKLEENKRSAKNYLAEMKAKYQELPGIRSHIRECLGYS